jgi:hypothetical protein
MLLPRHANVVTARATELHYLNTILLFRQDEHSAASAMLNCA